MPDQKYVYRFNGYRIDADHELTPDEVRQAFKSSGVDVPAGPAAPPVSPNASSMIRPDIVAMADKIDAQNATNAERDRNWPANFASRLPPSLQFPVGAGLSLIQPALDVAGVLAGGSGALRAARGIAPGVDAAAGVLADDIPVLRRTRAAAEAYRNANRPPNTAAELTQATPPAPAGPTVRAGAPDVLDQMLAEARAGRKPSGPPPTLRKGGSAPSVSDTLQTALDEAGAPNPAKGTTPPPPTTTPAGKPSITAEQYAQGERAAAQPKPPASAAPPPKPAAPKPQTTSKADKFADIPDDPAVADIIERMAGGPNKPVPGNGTGGAGLAEDLTRLRRKYGADRVGKTVNPKAPEAGTGSVLRADASQAPSAMPDIAQEALLRDLKTGGSKDPGKTLRALGQMLKEYERNKGPANSDVARELADLLKKHGFNTGIK